MRGFFPTKAVVKSGNSAALAGPLNAKVGESLAVTNPNPVMPGAATSTRTPWWFGLLFGVVGLGLMTLAWTTGIIQHYRLATYQPVQAHMIDAHVKVSRGRKSNSYWPVVSYSYSVAAKPYQSSKVFAVDSMSSTSYAETRKICDQHPAGSAATAWVAPGDPSRVFLLRAPSITPYVLALFALPFFWRVLF